MIFLKKNIFVFLFFTIWSQLLFAQTQNSQPDSSVPPEPALSFIPKSTNDEKENFELRKVPQSRIDSLKQLDDFWYADSSFKRDRQGQTVQYYVDSSGQQQKIETRRTRETQRNRSSWLDSRSFLIILVICFALIVFFLIRSNIVGVKKRIAPTEESEVEETENIFEINYQREIDKAIANQHYRLATRLMFLRLLKLLATKNIIKYKQERTNLDYLLQLHSSKHYNDFFRLTRNYEYVWYGKFDLTSEAFTVIKNDFENFDRKLN